MTEYHTDGPFGSEIREALRTAITLDAALKRKEALSFLGVNYAAYRRATDDRITPNSRILGDLHLLTEPFDGDVDGLQQRIRQFGEERQQLLTLPADEVSLACRLMKCYRDQLPEDELLAIIQDFSVRIAGNIADYYNRQWELLEQVLEGTREEEAICLLTTSWLTEGEDLCQVTVELPEWVWKSCGLAPSYCYEISVSASPGSDEWRDEVTQDLYTALCEEIAEQKKQASPVQNRRLDLFQESLAYEKGMDWGEWVCLDEQQPVFSMRRLLLMG